MPSGYNSKQQTNQMQYFYSIFFIKECDARTWEKKRLKNVFDWLTWLIWKCLYLHKYCNWIYRMIATAQKIQIHKHNLSFIYPLVWPKDRVIRFAVLHCIQEFVIQFDESCYSIHCLFIINETSKLHASVNELYAFRLITILWYKKWNNLIYSFMLKKKL